MEVTAAFPCDPIGQHSLEKLRVLFHKMKMICGLFCVSSQSNITAISAAAAENWQIFALKGRKKKKLPQDVKNTPNMLGLVSEGGCFQPFTLCSGFCFISIKETFGENLSTVALMHEPLHIPTQANRHDIKKM